MASRARPVSVGRGPLAKWASGLRHYVAKVAEQAPPPGRDRTPSGTANLIRSTVLCHGRSGRASNRSPYEEREINDPVRAGRLIKQIVRSRYLKSQ